MTADKEFISSVDFRPVSIAFTPGDNVWV